MEEIGLPGVFSLVAGLAGVFVLGHYVCNQRKGQETHGDSSIVLAFPKQQNQRNEEHQHDIEANLENKSTKSDDEEEHVDPRIITSGEVVVSPPSPSPRPQPPCQKKVFLDRDETWSRAEYLFPGLAEQMHRGSDPRQSVESHVWDLVSTRLYELRQDEENFARLMEPGNEIELCNSLGMNETVAKKRYEVVRNLQAEFGFERKTSMLTSILHLLHRIDVNNPYGEKQDIGGAINARYRDKDWLSYLGISVRKANLGADLLCLDELLEAEKYTNCYVHGTTATALEKITEDDGFVNESVYDYSSGKGAKHDFGGGVYCFKGDFRKALSFAIDRCWPIFDQETGRFRNLHNPAVILFPKPLLERTSSHRKAIYHVGTKKPFSDRHLKRELNESHYKNFIDKRKTWGVNDIHWKEFVKLARYHGRVPERKRVFYGLLHACDRTENTDRCEEPKVDRDRWEQHCIRNPRDLGLDRLFIEFDVDWNEWIELGHSDSEIEGQLKEASDRGKKELEKAVLNK
jgi:hypothetical protein